GELVERGIPETAQHVLLLGGCRADMANGEVCHGASPEAVWSLRGSPSVTDPCPPHRFPCGTTAPLQRRLSRPVRVFERFRGCCPFGARGLRGDSPGRCHQHWQSYPSENQIVGRGTASPPGPAPIR